MATFTKARYQWCGSLRMRPWRKIRNSQKVNQPRRLNVSKLAGGINCLISSTSGSPQINKANGNSNVGRPQTIADAYPVEISADCLTKAGRFKILCPAINQKRRKEA